MGLAESLTGGMIAARLCDIPGASQAFRGSIVSYASDVKFDLLGVPEGPVVSEEPRSPPWCTARAACWETDVGIAVTGVAGPDAQDGEEPGTVWMATLVDGEVVTQRSKFPFRSQPHASVHHHQRVEQPSHAIARPTRGMNDRGRLFVAVIPPASVLDLLETIPREPHPDVRYTTRDQWHITLRFLGDADIDELTGALDRVVAPTVEARGAARE